jgi:hypothetical protein
MLLSSFVLSTTITWSQSGNQMLDGIGETALVARYVFDGDVSDWSRNNLQAKLLGEGATFVNDEKFVKVLSLSGDGEGYISLSGKAIIGEEAITISGWINIRAEQRGLHFFDLGQATGAHFFVAPMGTEDEEGFITGISSEDGETLKTVSATLSPSTWNHIAVVLDSPSKSIKTYINGKLVGEITDKELELDYLFDDKPEKENIFFVGRSLTSGNPYLDAKLYDFRIYRTPLSEKQVSRIYHNVLKDADAVDDGKTYKEDNIPHFSEIVPQLYNEYLIEVTPIEVETVIGNLPRLPRYVQGVYRDGIDGPKVRVLWPAPTDNTEVQKAGQYTITGTVPGTNVRPKASVTVRDAKQVPTPNRQLEVFSLDQVALNKDVNGRRTKFIQNRDKFINTLAQRNSDDFLYMFRDAFGQEQPQGAKALGVWDSQETKLRGHATGHYLTALAQAYAGTGYDKSLQATFANKIEYMVDVLYDLAQKSGKPKEAGGEFVSDPINVPPGPGKSGYDSDLSQMGIRTDYWNWGKGFISAYPPDQFIMLENGATYGSNDSQVWAPYYTLHKILAGLMDIYEISGNKKALEVCLGMADWVFARLSQLPKERLTSMWNSYIAGEYGGMNEAMARLKRLTGEQKYLEVAKLFDNTRLFYGDAEHAHGLAKNVDLFRGLHANQHIPQIVGALETYRDSKLPQYYHVADNFWYKTTNDYMYTIGGVAGARTPANAECFIAQPATLYKNGFSAHGQNETCATYNMLKLTKNLFLFEPSAALMDYYERGCTTIYLLLLLKTLRQILITYL